MALSIVAEAAAPVFQGAASSLTTSVAVPTNQGDNLRLLAHASVEDGTTPVVPSGMTLGGQAMDLDHADTEGAGFANGSAIYSIPVDSTTGTVNLVVNYGKVQDDIIVYWWILRGDAVPERVISGSSKGANQTSRSVTLAALIGDLIIDGTSLGAGNSAVPTGTGHVEDFDTSVSSSASQGGHVLVTSDGNWTLGWNLSASTNRSVQSAVVYREGQLVISGIGEGTLPLLGGTGTAVMAMIGAGEGILPLLGGAGQGAVLTPVEGVGVGMLPLFQGSGTAVMAMIGAGQGTLPLLSGTGQGKAPRLRPSWPSSLPQIFLREGWSETAGDGAIRSDLGDVILTTRELSSAAPDSFRYSLPLGPEQLVEFENFYNFTTGYGSISFIHDRPGSGERVRMRFVGSPEIRSRGADQFLATGEMEIFFA